MTIEREVFQRVGLTELKQVADAIADRVKDFKVWLLYGPMGAGKTTLIKEIGACLGVDEVISSPTFAIVNEYETKDKTSIYHFDFYRIKNELEANDIGTEEYFYSGSACFVEWPEKIPSLVPGRHGKVTIQPEDITHRTIVISIHDGEEENRI